MDGLFTEVEATMGTFVLRSYGDEQEVTLGTNFTCQKQPKLGIFHVDICVE